MYVYTYMYMQLITSIQHNKIMNNDIMNYTNRYSGLTFAYLTFFSYLVYFLMYLCLFILLCL